jgi:hypothetical protein
MEHDAEFAAELLCRHHSLGGFKSGHRESDELAKQLLGRIEALDPDDFLAIAVVDQSHRIAAIFAAVDVFIVSNTDDQDPSAKQDESGAAEGGKWLFYYLLAIGKDRPTRTVWPLLLNEIVAIRDRRLKRDGYLGEVASPLRGRPRGEEENGLTRFLERHKFNRLEADGDFWFRPIDGDDDSGDAADPR